MFSIQRTAFRAASTPHRSQHKTQLTRFSSLGLIIATLQPNRLHSLFGGPSRAPERKRGAGVQGGQDTHADDEGEQTAPCEGEELGGDATADSVRVERQGHGCDRAQVCRHEQVYAKGREMPA